MCETASPTTIKSNFEQENRDCVFAYKRNNAKFAWPVNLK